MKMRTYFVLIVSVGILLTVSFTNAHGGDETATENPGDNHMSGDMGGHMGGDMDGNHMVTDHTGFESNSDHMEINGNVALENSITISVSTIPSAEMQEMMRDGHMDMWGRKSIDMMDYTNTMSVSLSSLVEFEDKLEDGFTSDDLILSDYRLNKTTLNEIEFNATENIYVISSRGSDVFTMIVEINSENNIAHGWKWSVIINYPYQSSTSSIAMIHKLNSQSLSMMDMHDEENYSEMIDHMDDSNAYFRENQMHDNHHNLPMRFSWDETAIVDNETQDVKATAVDEIFAISTIQGNQIYYDPEIGIDQSSIDKVNDELSGFNFGHFIDTIKSPSVIGLFLGMIGLSSLAIIANITKKRSNRL
ncbi:MAG: hypothetical protein ACXAD7_10560 [Candidatus Kariarchaeaceae archaeon]|jgi:hypothetical protein